MKTGHLLRTVILAAVVLSASGLLPAAMPGSAAAGEGIRGPQPFLTILCKFTDAPAEPEPTAFFDRLTTGPRPSLDDYWREVSYGRISLAGSRTTGWHTLPRPLAAYRTADGAADLAAVAADCVTAAGSLVEEGRYTGLGLVFNRDLESRPRAGRLCFQRGGARECHQVIWMWPAWMRSESGWAHEMGHVFGLDHSSDASGAPYANVWDVMSGFGGCSCGENHNAIAQHPAADQLDRLGWIPAARKAAVDADSVASFDLQPLAAPGTRGQLLVTIPTGETGRYYTVEARARAGYDEHAPGNAVIIHAVDTACPDHPAHLVTHPGEALTAAAGMWRPGETFSDETAHISISVGARQGKGFQVTVRTGNKASASASRLHAEAAPAEVVNRWTGGPVLGMAAGASGAVYVVSAKAGGLGISPEIQATRWQGETWGPAEPLPSGWSSMPGDAPAIAVGAGGEAFVAWSGTPKPFPTMAGGVDADIWMARRNAGGWLAPARINDDGAAAMQLSPALAAGPGGRVYVAWEDQRGGDRDIYFAEVRPDGTVTANYRVNDADAASQSSPAMAADQAGGVRVAWVDSRSGAAEIFAAYRSPSGEWGPNIRLAAAGVDVYGSPALAVDGAGNVHAAWIAYPVCTRAKGETGAVQAAVLPAGGEWEPAAVVAAAVDGGKESRPVIAAGQDGAVYLAWEEHAGAGIAVHLARRDARQGWAAMREIATDAAALSRPALAVDAAGVVHLAWLGDDGNAEHQRVAVTGARL